MTQDFKSRDISHLRMDNPNIFCNLRDLISYASSSQVLTQTYRALQPLQLSLRTPSNLYSEFLHEEREKHNI